MTAVRDSRFWEPLLERYPRSPSIALCRVPEVEYFSALQLEGPVLDHCCGDGYIANLCFPKARIDYGVDFSAPALQIAQSKGIYQRTLLNDLGKRIDLPDGSVGTVFNNSGIEHIDNLDGAVREVARVLRPGGKFHFNVLNKRYFDWWPDGEAAKHSYRQYQPFHHALDEAQWTEVLGRHKLVNVTFKNYFPRETARIFAAYDYRYSSFYIKRRIRLSVAATLVAPPGTLRTRWRKLFGDLRWDAEPQQGAGFMVTAVRAGN